MVEGMREAQIKESFQLVQVNFSGYNRPYEKHGNKYIVTAPGFMLKFDSISEERNENGDLLRIVQSDDVTGAKVESVMQFFDGIPVARMYNTVTNEGKEDQTLEYISSFSYWGIEKEQKEGIPELVSSDDKMSMVVVHNGWQKELTVKKYRFADLGMAQTQPHNYQRTSKTIEVTNTGNWSAKEYIPMGYIGNSAADSSLFFEIDHSGSWHYEIGDQNCHFYLAVSGPTEIQSHWSKNLKPGDSFTTVPVAVGVGHDDFEEAVGTLTKYRRRIRRPNKDNLEVMGINCKKASILPDECFFLRHGKRVYDRSRYQLDFRHPLVIEHVTEVIDRVVRDYGVGYIKMDYNIEPGIGTEVDADSFGDGLLEHERAYLAWLDGIYKKYPDLVIENCSSGGLRMDYAMLARNSIQSTSDQEDYRNYATISANAAIGVTPEQAAIWSYPLRDGTEEEVIFNMVNALLLRIHQSGHLAEISPERFDLVKEGIDCYKEIRSGIKDGVPFWPMGWADNEDKHLAAGIRVPGDVIYLGVWRRGGEADFEVPLNRAFPGKELEVSCIYPKACGDVFHYDDYSKTLQIHFPETYMARLFQIKVK